MLQLLNKNKSGQIEKAQQVYFGEKEGEKISAIRNTVIHDAKNLGLVPVLEPYSDKDSTMEQELANCHAVYNLTIYKMRKVCVPQSRSTVWTNRPIRLFTAKENEVLKQVAYVNYTLKELKEFMFVENCNVQ